MPLPPPLHRNGGLPHELILGYRFSVLFLAGGSSPNPLDLRFQKVSGLSAEVSTTSVTEGGQNLYAQPLPDRVSHGNLVLQRGMVINSPLNAEFKDALSFFKFATSNVLITLLQGEGVPVAAWMCLKAFPVKWSVSDLDADQKSVVIDTLELAYGRLQFMRV